ncbi:MAG: hypothetical protein ACRELF_05865 [Gemmataceae bacterium]
MSEIGRRVLTRPVGAAAGAVLILIFLGCMSLSIKIGCKSEPDGTTCQEGKVYLREGQELDVYYPIPYASLPNLELSGDDDDCVIIEQKADHFHIRYNGTIYAKPHWKARGLRCPQPAAIAPVIVPPPDAPLSKDGPPSLLPPPTPIQTP